MTTIISPRPTFRPRSNARKARRQPAAGKNLSFALVSQGADERAALEATIKAKFERVYGAQLRQFLPNLLRLGVAAELGAVVGIRAAGDSRLFLEQYLDQPVEQAIARAFRTPIDRARVVEIGNLAANVPGLAYVLFAVLATVLNDAGYRWVACTATPQVEAMLAKMHFASRTLCDADPSRLQEGAADWGDYYASKPRVIVGDVRLAAAEVAKNPELAVLVQRFAGMIAQMADGLKRAG